MRFMLVNVLFFFNISQMLSISSWPISFPVTDILFYSNSGTMHKSFPDDLPHNWISWILLFPLNISQIALRPSEPNSFSVDKNIKETPHLFQSSNIYSLPRQSFVSAVFFFNESHIAFTPSKLNLFSVYHFFSLPLLFVVSFISFSNHSNLIHQEIC